MTLNPTVFSERKRESDERYPPKEFNNSLTDGQYQRDRARIIHSASFRRLQSKTQVLTIGESDFYRTRLTHSLEVAQIGTSICENLRNNAVLVNFHDIIPPSNLIEAIGLAHDIGHPPFGHGGEIALNGFMKDSGGFEGNGQTLRIAAVLGEFSPNNGLDLTRRTLLGLLKYPATHASVANYSPKSKKPPKCIHDDEASILDWILLPFSQHDKDIITRIDRSQDEGRHHKTKYKSFDTSIMELADDIAYGVHDLEDAIALKLVNRDLWMEHVIARSDAFSKCQIMLDENSFYTPKLFSPSGKERKHAISKMVGYFISKISIHEVNDAENRLIKYNAVMEDVAERCLDCLKKFIREQVIFTPQVKSLEFKGQLIVEGLFKTFCDNPKDLLPKNTYEIYSNQQETAKKRIICDYIAGMTDAYAIRMYRRLFVPDVGSIFDHI